MKKVIAASVVITVLVGSSAVADIFQGFQHGVNLVGNLTWNSGVGGADIGMSTAVTNNQNATGVLSGATQSLVGSFDSIASGGGAGANIIGTVQIQSLGTDGGAQFGMPTFPGQVQQIGGNVSPMFQSQGVGIMGIQGLTRSEGPGGAEAENTASLEQCQTGNNNIGAMTGMSSIMATQTANVGGESKGVGIVNTSVTVVTAQVQVVN